MGNRGKSTVREYLKLITETAVFVFFVMTFVVQTLGYLLFL
jgi:hypothetical protein